MSKRTIVTAALPYANGPIHLGHLAGAYIPSDLYVRYKRMRGDEVLFICGSDENGVPITLSAEKAGVTPQEFVDKNHAIIKDSFDRFGISFDYYGRTSSKVHAETSQEIFLKLHEKGLFKQKTEQQLYDAGAGMFLPDRYVKGTCPVCGFEEAYGDQCENCGSTLSPSELINPKSALSGETPEVRETTHWYIPLGDLQPQIEEWISSRTNWKPNVMGQVKSWLANGLADRAVTRDLTWGVPVPLANSEGKVMYVWFDAPIGYISATKEWAIEQGDPDLWKKYWQDEDSALLHFIGKDNIVFHCIMFPATLMSLGHHVLPVNVPANEFLNLEGRKLSTSRGWAVWLHEYLEEFEADILRYALGTTLPETKDSDFSWKDFQARNNNELADVLGNFLYRTLSFINRYADGVLPELIDPSDLELDTLNGIEAAKNKIADLYESFRFREAIFETMGLARIGNKYFNDSEPWKTRKTDPQKCANTLYVSAQICAAISVLFKPVLPEKMAKLRSYLSVPENAGWDDVSSQTLKSGSKIDLGEILFKKIEDEQIQAQIDKLHQREAELAAAETETEYAALKPSVTFDQFTAMDIRTGTVLAAEKIKKSKKLLKLIIDLGFETRTIVSGISQYFNPEDVEGKQVTVLANLEPRKIMGIESKGMILMAEDPDGSLKLVQSGGSAGSTIA